MLRTIAVALVILVCIASGLPTRAQGRSTLLVTVNPQTPAQSGQPIHLPSKQKADPFDGLLTRLAVQKARIRVEEVKPAKPGQIVSIPVDPHETPMTTACALKMFKVDPTVDSEIHKQVPDGDFKIRRIIPPDCRR